VLQVRTQVLATGELQWPSWSSAITTSRHWRPRGASMRAQVTVEAVSSLG
jgi:hypothetical protein